MASKDKQDDDWATSPTNDGNMSKGDKIPLQKCWTFWFFKPQISGACSDESEAYNKQLQKLDDFETIQDFWACYNALPSPATLSHKHCFHMMKQGVKPEWEDKENQAGGTWNFKVDKQKSEEVWQTLLLAIIGEQFPCVLPQGDDICGVTAKGGATTANQLIFQVWHKNQEHKAAVFEKLKSLLSKIAELSSMFYKSNGDELRKAQGN
eukprot:TRINITY_DN68164_c7_g2_i1.p1 TRINITY_DN68164_c7_g2~~TRINITY_DN68164_c7_g2_i1.p1  ORF type:complete len:208 (+),score=21.44 TRINITY_DN68164_c7_g2_i1:39-662(+)